MYNYSLTVDTSDLRSPTDFTMDCIVLGKKWNASDITVKSQIAIQIWVKPRCFDPKIYRRASLSSPKSFDQLYWMFKENTEVEDRMYNSTTLAQFFWKPGPCSY